MRQQLIGCSFWVSGKRFLLAFILTDLVLTVTQIQLYFISMLAVYVVYLLYLGLRAFGELRAMNFLDTRLKFHAASMVVSDRLD